MMHKAWSSIDEVPYCFSRSSEKFEDHTGQKIANFDPNWAFLDCNWSLNSPMALKWCTKLNVFIEDMPYCFLKLSIKFQGHTGWKIDDLNPLSGLPRSGKSQGNSSLSQSQGKVREFCCKSGNCVICYQNQGKVREFHLWFLPMHFFIVCWMIFELGQTLKLCPHLYIICQMTFS